MVSTFNLPLFDLKLETNTQEIDKYLKHHKNSRE